MSKYKEKIISLFGDHFNFRGILNKPNYIQSIVVIFEHLAQFESTNKIVKRFMDEREPDHAYDTLFEAWIGYHLSINDAVTHLEYEPASESKPPDFRFRLINIVFDLQIKRIWNIYNEINEAKLKSEMNRKFKQYKKPWLINLRISERFSNIHINDFFRWFKTNFDNFSDEDTDSAVAANSYAWPSQIESDGPLISFSFIASPSLNHIKIGTHHFSEPMMPFNMLPVDIGPIRKKLKEVLKTSASTFSNLPGPQQCNLVVIQSETGLLALDSIVAEALWGTDVTNVYETGYIEETRTQDGVFANNKHSKISGIIRVNSSGWQPSIEFFGTFFQNPVYSEDALRQVKALAELSSFHISDPR